MHSDRSIRSRILSLAVLLISLCVSIALGEMILRVVFPAPQEYCVWPPIFHYTFKPLPAVFPGVSGESNFITNSKGVRGEELSNNYTYRILAIGGSTTECAYLDQTEAWPYLLQEKLNLKQKQLRVWVGNIGKSGLNSRHHVVEMRRILPQYPQLDTVIVLLGANDLALRLAQDNDYDPHFLDRAGGEANVSAGLFYNVPIQSLPFHRRTGIWRLFRRVAVIFNTSRLNQDSEGKVFITWREHRHNAAAIRPNLPDLTSALDEFRRNINLMIDLAQSRSIRLIFLTQPAMWDANLSQELKELLWLGGVGNFSEEPGKEYYSVEALSKGMQMYNETLLKTCRERGVECFDLASILPKNTTVFYDDLHFNESGSRMVADALTQYILPSLSKR